MNNNRIITNYAQPIFVTAGATYLDIDAYACCVAMAELLQKKGGNAIAFSNAPCNYSVCPSLIQEGQISKECPTDGQYIIVDVSDPEFLKSSVPLDRVVAIYDHHVGFEEYWQSRIGDGTHIEFIGAAATLIYREWQKANLQSQMCRETAKLLIAAILDNTLDLTSSNTTQEDIDAFRSLCAHANVDRAWCDSYFAQVQEGVQADMKNALFKDIKTILNNAVLPPRMSQLCVWDAESILQRLPQIRAWFAESQESWLVNVIDIQRRCCYFLCDDPYHQQRLQEVFAVQFHDGVAKTERLYLRKEIIKKIQSIN